MAKGIRNSSCKTKRPMFAVKIKFMVPAKILLKALCFLTHDNDKQK